MTPAQNRADMEALAAQLRDAGWTVQAPPTPTQILDQKATVAAHYAKCMAETVAALLPYVLDGTEPTPWAREKITEIFATVTDMRAEWDEALKARQARNRRAA